MSECSHKRRLAWRCRRGMLELDNLLIPFLEAHFETLSKDEQAQFEALLEEPDPSIYAWLMGHETPVPSFAPIITVVRTFHGMV